MPQIFAASKAVIMNADNKFLVINQTLNDGNKIWDLPGGKVEYGESPEQTLHREVKEEVHLDITITKPLGAWWFIRNDQNQVVCTTYLCAPANNEVDITQNPADENIHAYKWVAKEEFLGDQYVVGNDSLKELIKTI